MSNEALELSDYKFLGGETANLIGGSESDRRQLLKLLDDYLIVNAKIDWEPLLKNIWSQMPEAVFFNFNGHTYRGAQHWRKLWEYYGKNVKGTYYSPFDIGGEVTDQMAVLWCHRHGKRHWTTDETRPQPARQTFYDGEPFTTRSTMVFHKENGEWRVIHAHFSLADAGPRPGGI
jgi:hypothetical protein